MSPRVQLGESRLRVRRKRRRLYIVGGIAALAAILFLFVWWLSNASFLLIRTVQVSGADVVPAADIEHTVQQDLEGKYIGLFSKANIFLYSKNNIVRDILSRYPTLTTAEINAQDFTTIAVWVKERHPQALWCGAHTSDATNCLLLDADGLAYAEAPQYSGPVYQTYYGALPGGGLPRQFLTPGQFHSLTALVAALSKKTGSDTLQSVFVDENNDVRVLYSGGYEILFTLADDSGNIFNRFSLALTAEPLTSHPLSDFLYVDLRFGNKVYYKLKSQ